MLIKYLATNIIIKYLSVHMKLFAALKIIAEVESNFAHPR